MPLGIHRLPLLTAALTAFALAIWAIPGAAAALQYDRTALAGGELWRAVTGHWTHWNTDHLVWDLLVFAVFGALVESHSRRRFAAVVVGSALAISAAVWLLAPQLSHYRGLSGLDSALFAAFFAQLLNDAWRERSLLQAVVPALALLGFVSKSAFELTTGATLFVASTSAFTAVPLAHLVGAAVGVAMVFFMPSFAASTPVEKPRMPWGFFSTVTCVVLFLSTCTRHTIPSVEVRIPDGKGTFAYDSTKPVDITELLPFMRRATWTDDFEFWKVGQNVIMADGTRVSFEQFYPMFRIQGIDGTFLVTENDSAAYEKAHGRIIFGYLN